MRQINLYSQSALPTRCVLLLVHKARQPSGQCGAGPDLRSAPWPQPPPHCSFAAFAEKTAFPEVSGLALVARALYA